MCLIRWISGSASSSDLKFGYHGFDLIDIYRNSADPIVTINWGIEVVGIMVFDYFSVQKSSDPNRAGMVLW